MRRQGGAPSRIDGWFPDALRAPIPASDSSRPISLQLGPLVILVPLVVNPFFLFLRVSVPSVVNPLNLLDFGRGGAQYRRLSEARIG
jgi:hypothetical protein